MCKGAVQRRNARKPWTAANCPNLKTLNPGAERSCGGTEKLNYLLPLFSITPEDLRRSLCAPVNKHCYFLLVTRNTEQNCPQGDVVQYPQVIQRQSSVFWNQSNTPSPQTRPTHSKNVLHAPRPARMLTPISLACWVHTKVPHSDHTAAAALGLEARRPCQGDSAQTHLCCAFTQQPAPILGLTSLHTLHVRIPYRIPSLLQPGLGLLLHSCTPARDTRQLCRPRLCAVLLLLLLALVMRRSPSSSPVPQQQEARHADLDQQGKRHTQAGVVCLLGAHTVCTRH